MSLVEILIDSTSFDQSIHQSVVTGNGLETHDERGKEWSCLLVSCVQKEWKLVVNSSSSSHEEAQERRKWKISRRKFCVNVLNCFPFFCPF